MTIDELIALKTRLLQNPNDSEAQQLFSQAMQAMDTKQRQEVEHELSFIADFWQATGTDDQIQPSAQVRSRFYQMLEQQKQLSPQAPSLWQSISQWFTAKSRVMQPAFQFALVCIVFMAGMGAQNLIQSDDNSAVVALENQVEELNIMVALSLLQKSSASERLSGVAYSSRGGELTEALVTELLKLLESDKSTAVRLAIIEALSDYAMIGIIEEQILAALLKQDNVLVQIQLVELLKNHGSQKIIYQLLEQIEDERIHDEVRDAFMSRNQSTNV